MQTILDFNTFSLSSHVLTCVLPILAAYPSLFGIAGWPQGTAIDPSRTPTNGTPAEHALPISFRCQTVSWSCHQRSEQRWGLYSAGQELLFPHAEHRPRGCLPSGSFLKTGCRPVRGGAGHSVASALSSCFGAHPARSFLTPHSSHPACSFLTPIHPPIEPLLGALSSWRCIGSACAPADLWSVVGSEGNKWRDLHGEAERLAAIFLACADHASDFAPSAASQKGPGPMRHHEGMD